jgi:putative peptidoglycan lipid II flippase
VFVPWLGHAGLALSIGVAALINAGWLLWGLQRQGAYAPRPGWRRFVVQVMAGCAVLGVGLAGAAEGLDWAALRATPWLRVGWMVLCLGVAAVAYFGTLAAVGVQLRQFARRA